MTSVRGPGASARSIVVRTAAGASYRVLIGAGVLGRLIGELARGRSEARGNPATPSRRHQASGSRSAIPPVSRVVVISDRNVARLYGRDLVRGLAARGMKADLLSFHEGEAHKTRETKARLEDRLLEIGFGRSGILVALGGGVTGDLAGFLAATWHRGIPLIHVPTTLVAMIDSSIGGKVGVDHPRAKNLIGAFHSPLAVFADTKTLDTLSDRDLRAGLAEAVKCGAIADARLFGQIERERGAILARRPAALLRLVERTARFKARIVSLDERESDRRMLLNFGHTIGHALEAVSGFRLRHGEAVSIGMVLEARIALRLGVAGAECVERLESLLVSLRLPVAPPPYVSSAHGILSATRRDKKVRDGAVMYVLPKTVGRHAGGRRYAIAVPDAEVASVLREGGLR